jgi:hypothetical protein
MEQKRMRKNFQLIPTAVCGMQDKRVVKEERKGCERKKVVLTALCLKIW